MNDTSSSDGRDLKVISIVVAAQNGALHDQTLQDPYRCTLQAPPVTLQRINETNSSLKDGRNNSPAGRFGSKFSPEYQAADCSNAAKGSRCPTPCASSPSSVDGMLANAVATACSEAIETVATDSNGRKELHAYRLKSTTLPNAGTVQTSWREGKTPIVSEMLSIQQKLELDVKNAEKRIFELEGNYLKDTCELGNIIKGWDGYVAPTKSRRSQYSSKHTPTPSPSEVSLGDRLFSLSNYSSVVSREFRELKSPVADGESLNENTSYHSFVSASSRIQRPCANAYNFNQVITNVNPSYDEHQSSYTRQGIANSFDKDCSNYDDTQSSKDEKARKIKSNKYSVTRSTIDET